MNVRRERKDAAEHRKLILRTAESLFAEHGVNGVSMHQIAKTAGIGQGTLYRRYAHKGDLCCDLVNDHCVQLMEISTKLLEQQGKSSAEKLGELLDLWIDALEEKADLVIVIESQKPKEWDERGTTWFHSPMYRFMLDSTASLLRDLLQERPVQPFDPMLTAHALICSIAPAGYFHFRREQGYSVEQMKRAYRQMYQLPTN
ncbi:TetR/AcrR family transcriptional regulator [Cohnella faecalis]|nr:TetR/AcrR family transcriptional regulator [Cohnella faecalis]